MRYLSVFKSTKTRFGVQSRRGHRDAKLARSVQKKASRATISIHIAARSLRQALCTRPATAAAPGARESEEAGERNEPPRCDSDAQEEARREPRARGFV